MSNITQNATTRNGKPCQVGDFATVTHFKLTSVNLPNVTGTMVSSGLTVTTKYANCQGPNASGASYISTPVVGESLSFNGTINSITGVGQQASIVVKLQDNTTVTVQGQDIASAQTL
jgi:hypothetical protein